MVKMLSLHGSSDQRVSKGLRGSAVEFDRILSRVPIGSYGLIGAAGIKTAEREFPGLALVFL